MMRGMKEQSRDICVSAAASRPRNPASVPGRGKKFMSSTTFKDRLYGPPSLLSSWVSKFLCSGRGVKWPRKLITYLNSVRSLRMYGAVPPLTPILFLWSGA
jgi:hypothetical protein